MINIKFYQKAYQVKKKLENKQISSKEAFKCFEDYRQLEPVLYNIETTNNCNMNCKMCPRPKQMTRPVGTMSMQLFERIVKQLKPWTNQEWNEWKDFVKKNYKVKENEMNENHFFFYIVPQVITLHGFGEPLLDKYIINRIKCLKKYNLKSYFSCNPYNITLSKGYELLKYGIDYLKFSAEDVNLFKKSEYIIKELMECNKGNEEKTRFIIDIVGKEKDYLEIKKMFKDYNVYMYLKSQDNQWYKKANFGQHSIHWLEPCQFAWSSMTIQYNGDIVPCSQIFNKTLVLGNANKDSLFKIWNSLKYYKFRKHQLLTSIPRCAFRCDMKLLGDF